MRITFELPKEFEQDWNTDRFEDCFNRLITDAHCLAGNYEKEVCEMLIKAFKNASQK